MTEETKELMKEVRAEKEKSMITFESGIIPKSYDEVMQFAGLMYSAKLAPPSLDSGQKIAIAMMMAMELGMPIISGIQSIAVINNRAGIWGDAALALVRRSGLLEEFKEWSEGDRKTDGWVFYCKLKRKGYPETTGEFSWAEAKDAGFNNPKMRNGQDDPYSPWRRFPNRMMTFKARNFVLRDQFGDVLRGMATAEDLGDIIDMRSEGDTYSQDLTVAEKSAEKMEALKKGMGIPDEDKDAVPEDSPKNGAEVDAELIPCAACGEGIINPEPQKLFNHKEKKFSPVCDKCYDQYAKKGGGKVAGEDREKPGSPDYDAMIKKYSSMRGQFEGTIRHDAAKINNSFPGEARSKIAEIWNTRVKRGSIEGDPVCPITTEAKPETGTKVKDMAPPEDTGHAPKKFFKEITGFVKRLTVQINRLGEAATRNFMEEMTGTRLAEEIPMDKREEVISGLARIDAEKDEVGKDITEETAAFVKVVMENVLGILTEGEIFTVLREFEIDTPDDLTLKEILEGVDKDKMEAVRKDLSEKVDMLMA